MNTPEHITSLSRNERMVFGSNTAGKHGKGAAHHAMQMFAAEYGVGEGPTGQCYALPTKDASIKSRSIEAIKASVRQFISYAVQHPELRFLVTKVGCGLAGFTVEQIAPMFIGAPGNVILPLEFEQHIERITL